jgi:hypothetical protein
MPVVIMTLLETALSVDLYRCDFIWINQLSAKITIVDFFNAHMPSLPFGLHP